MECTRDALGERIGRDIQVYEKLNLESLAVVRAGLDWSELRVYDLNAEGRNHGILLGAKGWSP